MKKIIIALVLFSSNLQAAQEKELATLQNQSNQQAIAPLAGVLPVVALQHLVLGYLSNWEKVSTIATEHKSSQVTFSSAGNIFAYAYDTGEGYFNLLHNIFLARFQNNGLEIIQVLQDKSYNKPCRFAFSLDGTYLAAASDPRAIKIWKHDGNNQFTCIETLQEHTECVNSVAFSCDGMLVSGSHDKSAKIWQIKNNKFSCVQTLSLRDAPGSVAISPDGTYLAVAVLSPAPITLWQRKNNRYESTLR